jgi:hypothetical protein
MTMSFFGKIMDKIFHGGAAKAATPGATEPSSSPTSSAPSSSAPAQASPQPTTTSAPTKVDVGAVLSEMASMKGGGGNYQTSIVDLLKLLDLDSSLDARKQLAEELSVHAGDHGTPEQNIALHKAVMNKLAENGGVVPDSLRN